VRHVGVREIVGDGVDAGLRYDLTGLVFLRDGLAAGSLMQASAKGPQREGGSRMADLRHGASSNSCPGTGDRSMPPE
jgi:hypothetical protein